MMTSAPKVLAGLVLAAGGSTRLGTAKQLLIWRGKTLICHAVEQSLAVCGAGVVVVSGAHADAVALSLRGYPVDLVHNPDWQTGVAGSLTVGVDALRSRLASGVLVTLCDQPLVTRSDLVQLAELWQTASHKPAAAQYNNILGVPAIFPSDYFDRLAGLQGDTGARALLRVNHNCTTLAMPGAAMDIDTAEDIKGLRRYDN